MHGDFYYYMLEKNAGFAPSMRVEESTPAIDRDHGYSRYQL